MSPTRTEPRRLLDDALLERIHDRAAEHDRAGSFPHEDLAELQAAGYLAALVPERLGGAGLSLAELTREQTRLAQAAPATALTVNGKIDRDAIRLLDLLHAAAPSMKLDRL